MSRSNFGALIVLAYFGGTALVSLFIAFNAIAREHFSHIKINKVALALGFLAVWIIGLLLWHGFWIKLFQAGVIRDVGGPELN